MTGRSAWRQVVRALNAWDAEVFGRTAARRSPALDVVLPALTRAADHSLLWAAIGAGMMATGRRRAHRAARRGLASVAVASALTNGVGRRVLGRTGPAELPGLLSGVLRAACALLRRLPLQARRRRRRVRRRDRPGGAYAGGPAGRARRDAGLRARLHRGALPRRRPGRGRAGSRASASAWRRCWPSRPCCAPSGRCARNGRYQPYGFAPGWRPRLDDGILDVRLVEAGHRFAAIRLLGSLATGRRVRSRVYVEAGSAGLRVSLPDGPTALSRDGEIEPGSAELSFGTARRTLTVYRPAVRGFL